MEYVHNYLKKSEKRGFSLVIIMILLFSFLAAYPLITRQVDNGQRLAETFERWTQLQVARDSALQIIASASIQLPATYSYTIGKNSSYTIQLSGAYDSYLSTQFVSSDTMFARASSTAYVERSGALYNAGFDVGSITASFSHSIGSMKVGAPASYASWTQNL